MVALRSGKLALPFALPATVSKEAHNVPIAARDGRTGASTQKTLTIFRPQHHHLIRGPEPREWIRKQEPWSWVYSHPLSYRAIFSIIRSIRARIQSFDHLSHPGCAAYRSIICH